MPWFRTESNFANHPKIKQLSRKLKISRVEARGLVIGLWCDVCETAPDGVMSGWDTEDIEDSAGWDGAAGEFVTAMLSVGLIDDGQDGLEIHDWMEYAEGHKAAQRLRKHREKKRKSLELGGCSETDGNVSQQQPNSNVAKIRTPPLQEYDLQRRQDQTGPDLTRQDRTGPDDDDVPAAAAARIEYPVGTNGALYLKHLEPWGIESGYGAMGGAAVTVQKLTPLTRDELEYADLEMRANGDGKLRWNYLVQCIKTYRERRLGEIGTGRGPAVGYHPGSDFSGQPVGSVVDGLTGEIINPGDDDGSVRGDPHRKAEAGQHGTTGDCDGGSPSRAADDDLPF